MVQHIYCIILSPTGSNLLEDQGSHGFEGALQGSPQFVPVRKRINGINPNTTELLLYKSWSPKGCFQFEIIINVLVSSS